MGLFSFLFSQRNRHKILHFLRHDNPHIWKTPVVSPRCLSLFSVQRTRNSPNSILIRKYSLAESGMKNEWMHEWMTDGNEYYQGKSMVGTKTNRRLGGIAVSETVRECFSNKMTFKQDLERVASMWQCVWRRDIQREERLATEELRSWI